MHAFYKIITKCKDVGWGDEILAMEVGSHGSFSGMRKKVYLHVCTRRSFWHYGSVHANNIGYKLHPGND